MTSSALPTIRCLLFGVLVFGLPSTAARAAIIVSIENKTVSAGSGVFTVDVTAVSDAPLGDEINEILGRFLITPVAPAGNNLQFFEENLGLLDQADPQLSDMDYLFFGNSFFTSNPGFEVATLSTTNYAFDTYEGLDFRNDTGTDVILDGTRPLLFRLQLLAPAILLTDEDFIISGLPGTYFLDNDDIPVPFTFAPGTHGQITILNNAAAVPEPTSFAAIAVAASGFVLRRRHVSRRTRRILERGLLNS